MKFSIGDKTEQYPLSQGIYKIGRSENKNRPAITGPEFPNGRILGPSHLGISRNHLEIKVSENEATLRDMGSSNGTFLNDLDSRFEQIAITKPGNYKIILAGILDLYLEAKE